ncbi:MAG TPA: CopG family ribbon-helix-helix protein [Methanothermococcus okinawensis]|uniref:CopG family ribbon-helix-helix protein n=1 Tax=Methanothermococcus okinawensis TaxID=155863 RepID=A0A832YU12_9EURY|nr:CopG family ribbon-helix-helix protein [Methanothermococcus okinawensis]
MVNVERISVSFPKFLLKEIDEITEKKGYSSRSEFIRDSIRKNILENNQLDREGFISGIVIIVYSPTKNAMEKMSRAYFEHNSIIKSINQYYIKTSCGKYKKVETFIIEGNSEDISNFYDKISNLEGKVYDKIIIF